MKRYILVITILMLLSVNVFSAFSELKFNGGIYGGISYSNYIGSDLQRDSEFRKNYILGSYLRIYPSHKFFVQPEIMYSKKGSIDDWKAGEYYRMEIKLTYIDFNLLAGIDISDYLSFLFGPYFGIYLNGRQSEIVNNGEKNEFEIPDGYLSKYDYGIMIGTSINFIKYFSCGMRYYYGLKGLYRSYANYYGVDPLPGINYEKYLDIRNSYLVIIFSIGF